MNKKIKDDFIKEINELEQVLDNLVGNNTYFHNIIESKYNKCEYKKVSKELLRKKIIKNLKTTAFTSIVALPLVLSIGVSTTIGFFGVDDVAKTKPIYIDNTGYYQEYESEISCNDIIIIKTPYEEKNKEYIRNVYILDDKNIKDEKDLEELFNENYKDILANNKAKFLKTETTDNIGENNNQYISFYGDYKTKEKTTISSSKDKFMTIFLSSNIGLLLFLFIARILLSDIVYDFLKELKYNIKEEKNDIKKLIKEKKDLKNKLK